MKTTTLSFLWAAFTGAAVVLAGGVQIATGHNMQMPEDSPVVIDIPIPEAVQENEASKLELRQAQVVNPAATQGVLQVPSVTVQVLETLVPGATAPTWLPFTYTQTFVPTPDPWPSPIAGTIGFGTLSKTKNKREAEPTPAPAAYGIAGRIHA